MLTCDELISSLIKIGKRDRFFRRELVSAIGHDVSFPNRNPDLYFIDHEEKKITWIEIDKNHKTGKGKLEELYLFADELLGEEWSLSMVLYFIHPIVVFAYQIDDMASPLEKETIRKSQLSEHIKYKDIRTEMERRGAHPTKAKLRKMMSRSNCITV